MPKVPAELSPAQEVVARINERVGRIGAAPRKMPANAEYRGTFKGAQKLTEAMGRTRAERSGQKLGGLGPDGSFLFEQGTAKGNLERTLARIQREISEGVASGTMSTEEAADAREDAEKMVEGLAPIVGDDKSALDRVMDSGGNALTWGLRQIVRPGQASLNAIAELHRQGEENPLKIGPVEINRGILGFVPGVGIDQGDVLREAVQGARLEGDLATPGSILNETADIRESRGKGRGFFGTDVDDVSTSPLVNNVATDLGVRIVTDPLSYVGFGTGAAGRGALNAADEVIPGIAARLRTAGLSGLDDAERATLSQALPPRTMQILRTAQGGVRIRAPFGRASEGRTVIPGATIRKPLTALAGDSPVLSRLADARYGGGIGRAARSATDAVRPRAALRRLGDRVERDFDDTRVAMTAGAGSRTQRQIDELVHEARKVPDLTPEDLALVTRALDIGGQVDALPARLQPLGTRFSQWRQTLTDEQVAEGVLMGAEQRLLGLARARDAALDRAGSLRTRLAELEAREAAKLADATPAAPGPVIGRIDRDLTDAGYRGGRSDQRASVLDAARDARRADATAAAADQEAILARDLVEGPNVSAVDDLPTIARPLTDEQLAAQEARELSPLARAEAKALRDAEKLRARQAAEARRAEAAADRTFQAQEDLMRRAQALSDRSFKGGQRSVNAVQALRKAQIRVQREIKEADRALAEAEDAFRLGTVADEDYFPRILTPEARRVMTAQEEGTFATPATGVRSSVAGDKFVTARRPEWATRSIDDINAEMAPIMEKAAELGIIKADGPLDWFDTNPFTAFAQRDLAARRHIVGKQFYNRLTTVLDDTGAPVARRIGDLPPEITDQLAAAQGLTRGSAGARERVARELTGSDEWTFMEVPALGAGMRPEWMLVRSEIADELTSVASAFAEPRTFLKFVDDWQNLWKSYATVPLPFGLGFHLRNAQGNVFLNWLKGLTRFGPYRRAFQLQRAVTRGIDQFGSPFALLDEADTVIVREAMDRGVIGAGFFDLEVGRQGQRGVISSRNQSPMPGRRRSAWEASNPLSTDNLMISGGRKFGTAVENNARLAHFIWKLDEIGSPAEAARSVRATLFDYSDLTQLERGVIKRLVPFYTFMRKSAPTVVEGFVSTPSKLSRIQQVRMALAEDAEDPEGLYPRWLTDQAGTPLPQGVARALANVPGLGVDADAPLVLTPDLPLLAPSETLTDLLALTSALPGPNLTDRTPSEGLQGLASLVAGGAPGAASTAVQTALGRRFFNGSTLTDRPVHASPFALPFSRRRDVDGDGDLERSVTAKTDFGLESLFPLASKLPFGTPGEEDKVPRRLLSTATGVRLYPLGESTQDTEAWARRDRLIDLLNDLVASGRVREGRDDEKETDR